jgi:RimJ/RimL family protein N-acetyltransferase
MANVVVRAVRDEDLPIFFKHQRDPVAVAMADVPSRERAAFDAHWEQIRGNPRTILRTIEVDGEVVGNLVSWKGDEERLVGYWIGREHWGKGIATEALRLFLEVIPERPLVALVAHENRGSIRVLEKCGFVRVGADEQGPVFRLDAPAESNPSCDSVEERP